MHTSKKLTASLRTQLVSAVFWLGLSHDLHREWPHNPPTSPSIPRQKSFASTAANTYVFGVNERGELQPIYWGGAPRRETTRFPRRAHTRMGLLRLSHTTTPQEYAGWGAGLFVEPALKITFPDGNRDLVLHYVSHTVRPTDSRSCSRISRATSRDPPVLIDPSTGILGRSRPSKTRPIPSPSSRPPPLRGPCRRRTTRSATSPAAGRASSR